MVVLAIDFRVGHSHLRRSRKYIEGEFWCRSRLFFRIQNGS
jgi:hypothetical protein